ncbi:hypothetical protein TM48_03869 [Mycobacterium shottsii]|uniref:Uncharacterized protein n=1 Tax=Mycobacterium shottsii TaxID=133549 RepID=A0A7I7LJB0_9MYCO|nr:hypothetical protein [Mycobacterium shottsii]QYL29394.1 hypothetical protein TM48_03869 [Mycobacterium shottsii]BBX59680.1 hypothetical protein MSHO_50250 [Mycobacterium shottsii]
MPQAGVLLWTPECPTYDGTPERLAAPWPGRAVAVNAGYLPRWSRRGLGVNVTVLICGLAPTAA